MQQANATFIKGIGFDGKIKGYAVIYKGEEIASGTAKEVRETLRDVWNASGSKLIEVLDNIWLNKSYKLIEILFFETTITIKKNIDKIAKKIDNCKFFLKR
ncbi:hypothetical protein [Flavobacterium covae]|uniref:hypothetical protein n=1 Tax=Flavobacterium covae TaxID=2906076 RepID=UPI001FB7BF64|nr:hypothetical protein [Flavobacterium covae]MCJ1805690.1 hypothetical protein [Flavobacterium covae]